MIKYSCKTHLSIDITKIIATMPTGLKGNDLLLAIKTLLYTNDDNALTNIASGVYRAILATPELITTSLVIDKRIDD